MAWTQVVVGDCLEQMQYLPNQSIQCCVTSPPYYGLRNYDNGGKLGLESHPDHYVASLVAVFREVRRVLRDDGTFWLNLGDSYHKKNRLMMPARVALALQADGWWLRDEIVWHKPRTTPAPLKDRTVPAHEMVYLLTKNARYYFDYLAIEEPATYAGVTRKSGKAFRDLEAVDPNAARKRPSADREIIVRDTRRKRSVWSISPSPFKDGHFATMPLDLAQVCLAAGSKAGDLVLDPFGGAGTTALAANRLGRNAILIELKADYAEIARQRVARG